MSIRASVFSAIAILAGTLAGCGSSGGDTSGTDGGKSLFDGGGVTFKNPGGDGGGGDGSMQGLQGQLTIMPTTPVVTVITGQALPTVSFTAAVGGVQTGVAWSIDRGDLGTISATGTFTPTGTIGGVGNITAAYGSETATTTVTVNISTTQAGDPAWSATPLDAGAGGYGGVGGNGPGAVPTTAQITTLNGGSTADAGTTDAGTDAATEAGTTAGADAGANGVSILYPYDGTVWPQGLLAPLLQWNPGAYSFDSVYVHVTETNYEYKGYFAANNTPFVNLPIPQAAWQAMTFSNGGGPLVISLVFAQGTNVYGPFTESWTIAQTTMQGTIYYNSYGTSLVKNSGNDGLDKYGNQYGAGTLAIAPGATSPVLVAGVNSINPAGDGTGCRVCHTVSADGKSLVTQASTANENYADTVFINLAMDTTAGAGTSLTTANLAFPALSKDGSLLFSGAGGMIYGDTSSKLYSMPMGTPVAGVTGLPANFQGTLPAFSPDGHHVSFNFWAGSFAADAGAPDGGTLTGDGNSLGILDFDGVSAFTNPRVLFTPPAGESVTYSSFDPDSAGIVFEVELKNNSGQWGYTWQGNTGELWWVDIASGMAHRLDVLNGYGAGGAVYLPNNAPPGANTHTSAQDAMLNYEPTMNPIASGGYAWVVFTSRRMYGNVAQLDPWTSDPRQYKWLDQVTDKKLWVAAINLGATPGTDASHPPFYLPAQELYAGNSRGYWSVEACRANGQSCMTGDQCCGGYCQTGPGDAGLICTSQMPKCSALYDKCSTTSDCCGAGQGVTCINQVCSQSQPPPQ